MPARALGRWGGHPLENSTSASCESEWRAFGGGGVPHGKAGQGSPGQQSRERCPSEWPKHGQGQEQGS